MSRWAVTSRALWGGVIARASAVVVTGGTLVGGAIASRRAAQAAAAPASPAAVSTRPAAKPGQPTPTPELVQVPGEQAPRPGVAGTVLDVTGEEITIKSLRGPT